MLSERKENEGKRGGRTRNKSLSCRPPPVWSFSSKQPPLTAHPYLQSKVAVGLRIVVLHVAVNASAGVCSRVGKGEREGKNKKQTRVTLRVTSLALRSHRLPVLISLDRSLIFSNFHFSVHQRV